LNGGTSNLTGGDLELVGGAGVGDGASGGIRFYNWNTVGSGNNPQTVINEIAAITGAGNLQLDGGITTGSTSFVNSSGVIQVATQGTIDHDSLANYVANEHIDWTGASAGTIHSTNIPTLNQDTTGNAATATLATTAQRILGSTDGDVTIISDGEVTVKLDADNDESTQKFKVTDNSDTEVFSVNESGFTTFTNTVAVASRISNTGTDNDLTIDCDGSMVFVIDADNDESGQSFSFRDTISTEVANISQTGVVSATSFRQDGNFNIAAIGDGVAIHVDAADITDGLTAASGTALSYNHVAIENPRLFATNSNVTTTTASTLYIKGAPVAQTNQTLTNSFALFVGGGTSYFNGDISVLDLTVRGNDIKDDDGTTCITFDSSGNTAIAGDLTVTGNDIKDSGGSAAITFDGSANTAVTGNLNVAGIITGKQRQIYQQSFIDDLGTTKHYLPWRDTDEQTLIYQEEAAMVAPYDGRIVSVTIRMSTVATTGNRTIGIHTFGPNASQFTTSNWTEEETETLAINSLDDNHVFYFVFDNAKHFESGELVTISIQDDADLHSGQRYTYVSTVVEWDYNNGLGTGGSSAEFDSAQ
jgi:hypothetical protein